ncbi:DHH family phosphoesterase [Patescibacteria group bacterium]
MPTEIKNLKKGAIRILEAVKNKERIIIYGDADPDGISSVVILKEALEVLAPSQYKKGRLIEVYFPNRETEGYGINEKALKFLKKKAPALFITLDCGIGNVKEVDLAKKMGFEIIIIDHHEVLSKVPKASIIIDPKQKQDKYPFKQLSAAAICYKLVKTLLSLAKKSYQPEKFLELVAISTLADQMPVQNENVKLIREGILALNYTKRKGLKTLIKETGFKTFNPKKVSLLRNENFDIEEIWQKIISPLNASGFRGHLTETYLLLTAKTVAGAKVLAKTLIKKQEKRREEMKRIFDETETRINPAESIVFEGDPSWPLILMGPVASRICRKYNVPTFLFKKGKKESPGSVRTPSGVDGVKAMASCNNLLKTYGGHPLASGFRVKNENLKKFKKGLIKYIKKL